MSTQTSMDMIEVHTQAGKFAVAGTNTGSHSTRDGVSAKHIRESLQTCTRAAT